MARPGCRSPPRPTQPLFPRPSPPRGGREPWPSGRAPADDPRPLLPMDPAIRIEQVQLAGGQLALKGQASVTP